jgi:hypothetical protein
VRIYCDENGTYQGEVFLADKKTAARARSIPLTDSLCRELLVLNNRKVPNDPVFSRRYQQRVSVLSQDQAQQIEERMITAENSENEIKSSQSR